jgi:hypothetical protein
VILRKDNHPLSIKNYVFEHRFVYYEKNGMGPHDCHWCGKPMAFKDMHVDHLNCKKQDNRIENLVSSCLLCNIGRGSEKRIISHRLSVGRWICVDGENLVVSQWARKLGVPPQTITARLKRGWSEEEAVTIPPLECHQAKTNRARKP